MRLVALVSGGKDSCFAMMQALAHGHQLVALANLLPADAGVQELDSFMFQTVGHGAVGLYGECLGLPLYRRPLAGAALVQSMAYETNSADEVEDLHALLAQVKAAHPDVEGVLSGAILSNYQRARVEHVCGRLGLTSLAPLWQRDQDVLLDAMIACGIDAILVKIASMGLKPDHLGRSLVHMQPIVRELARTSACQVCGEGGEYESLTLDCPLFSHVIALGETRVVVIDDNAYAPVAHLHVAGGSLVAKDAAAREAHLAAALQRIRELDERLACEAFSLSQPLPVWDAAASAAGVSCALLAPTAERPAAAFRAQPRVRPIGPLLALSLHATPPRTAGEVAEPIGAQVARLLTSLDAALGAHGLCLAQHAIFVSIFVRDLSAFAAINAAYSAFFRSEPPARATLQLPLEEHHGAALAIELLAASAAAQPRVRALHVQSVSHWAPANIGPYSQAKTLDGAVLLAGQIGLVPLAMALPRPAGASAALAGALPAVVCDETTQVLRNVHRMLATLGSSRAAACAVLVWLADARHVPLIGACLAQFFGTHAPAIWYVEAGALPRGALLELQIIAATCAALADDGAAAAAAADWVDDGVHGGCSVARATVRAPLQAGEAVGAWRHTLWQLAPSADALVSEAALARLIAERCMAAPADGGAQIVRVYLSLPLGAQTLAQLVEEAREDCVVSVMPSRFVAVQAGRPLLAFVHCIAVDEARAAPY